MLLKIQTETIELAQALKRVNLVQSGGEAKFFIQNGDVILNGAVETRRGKKIRAGDRIQFMEHDILVQAEQEN